MKIAFFFDSAVLDRPWSFEANAQVLSGTDGSLVALAAAMARIPDFKVTVYATSVPVISDMAVILVENLRAAMAEAERQSEKFLVFVASSEASQIALLAEERRHISLIAWAQCSPSFEWMTAAFRNPKFHRLIAVSNIQRAVLAYHPVYRKTWVIPNFVDVDFWNVEEASSSSTARIITYVGALKPGKGFHHLSAIWPEVRKQYPDWGLIVCGSPGLYGLSEKLGDEGIAEADFELRILTPLGGSRESAAAMGVTFVGSLTKTELRKMLLRSRATVVNPNQYDEAVETFCVAAAESLALGIPVIGGAAGGLLEIVEQYVGGVLTKGETELSKAIGRLIVDIPFGVRLGKQGQSRIRKHYNKSTVMRRWEALFRGESIAPQTMSARAYRPRDFVLRSLMRILLPVSIVHWVQRIRHKYAKL